MKCYVCGPKVKCAHGAAITGVDLPSLPAVFLSVEKQLEVVIPAISVIPWRKDADFSLRKGRCPVYASSTGLKETVARAGLFRRQACFSFGRVGK